MIELYERGVAENNTKHSDMGWDSQEENMMLGHFSYGPCSNRKKTSLSGKDKKKEGKTIFVQIF